MRSLTSATYLLGLSITLAGIVGQVLLLWLLQRKNLLRVNLWYPLLLAFYVLRSVVQTTLSLLSALGGEPVRPHSILIPYVLGTGDCLLQLALLISIARPLLRELRHYCARFLRWSVELAGCLTSAWVTASLGNWPVNPFYLSMLDNLSIFLLVLFVEISVLAVLLLRGNGRSPMALVRVIALGFGFYALVSLLSLTLLPGAELHRNTSLLFALQYVRISSYLAAVSYWIVSVFRMYSTENTLRAPEETAHSHGCAQTSSTPISEQASK